MTDRIPDFGPKADALVAEAVARFSGTFKLRNHEGTFRVSESSSYFSQGRVLLYTEREVAPGDWRDFAKGTEAELNRNIVR